MKKKVLLTSILSIVMCVSLVCGASFALFTSESKVNVAVTSGTVKVVAVPTIVTEETELYNGTATIKEDGNIVITNMLPMDKVTVNVEVDNQSTVTVQYYTQVQFKEQNALTEELNVTVNGETLSSTMCSGWKVLTADTDGTTLKIVIELPEEASESNGGYTCEIAIAVNAVQGNADVQPFATTMKEFTDNLAGGGAMLANDLDLANSQIAIANDAVIDLNDNALKAINTIRLNAGFDLTMKGGDYENANGGGKILVGDNSNVTFEDVNFSYNQLKTTKGSSTNRLESVVEVSVTDASAKTVLLFKNCTFNNAQIRFLLGCKGEIEATFENCTFTALTNSAPIYADSGVKGTINIINCTFNIEATSKDAAAIYVNSFSTTAVDVIATNNTLNGTKATATDSSLKGTKNEIKVDNPITSIGFINLTNKNSSTATSSFTETGTTKTGIAQ